MKTDITNIILCAIALIIVVALTGCVTKATESDTSLIQRVLDKTLPKDFTGPLSASHANQYFSITIEADGLKHNGTQWTWTWLTYERTSHFPLFSGLTWSSTGKVTLGRKP